MRNWKLFFVFLPTLSQSNITKSVVEKKFLHFNVLPLRLSTMKLLFKVAFIVVISGNMSISFYFLMLVCHTNSVKYRQKGFLVSCTGFIFPCLVPTPADLIIIMKPMRYIMIPFSECHMAYFYFFYVDTPPVSCLSDIFQCRLDKVM